jgi:hypothetical protein
VPKFRQNEENQNKKEYYFVNILLLFFSGEEINKFWGKKNLKIFHHIWTTLILVQ